MRLDLHHRPTLLKSWLATLHGPELRFRPVVVGPLPGWAPLLRTAVAWHLAYALVGYAGALVVARGGSTSPVAVAVREGGSVGVVLAGLALWWSGVALGSALWWVGVREVRAVSGRARA